MPRLTNHQYLANRESLRKDWYEDRAWTFAKLDPIDELTLHRYYAVTKDVSESAAIAHRHRVTQEQPSLPHTAGRAFARAREFLGTRLKVPLKPVPVPATRGGKRRIIVTTVSRPTDEIEIPLLLRTLKQIRDEEDRAA